MDSLSSSFLSSKALIEEGDTVIVYVNFGSAYAIEVERGKTLSMRYGALRHDFLIDKPYGARVSATAGYVHCLRPTPELWSRTLPHRTQILYPPDAALITLLLELRPGAVVLEAGTGSGALSHALARAIAPDGHLHTFDVDAARVRAAAADLARHGLAPLATVAERDVCALGFGVDGADAVFLDMPCPWQAVDAARAAMRRDRATRFCAFSPCVEQAQRTTAALRRHFVDVETVELVPRSFKVIEQKLEYFGAPDDAQAGGDEPSAKAAKVETAAEKSSPKLSFIPFPSQQPTHTGYITSATLLQSV